MKDLTGGRAYGPIYGHDLTPKEAEAFRARLLEQWHPHIKEVRQLPDGSFAGLTRLIFTDAIMLGMTIEGHAYRFCFEDKELCKAEFDKLTSEDDVPQGWVARRIW